MMKKLLAIIVLSLIWSGNASSEILKIDCTIKFNNEEVISNYFELNSETKNYYNEFEGDQVFWTSVTETSNNEWMPIYHHVNRRSGVYTAGFGVKTKKFPKRGDPMIELIAERIGSCKAATSKRKF